MRNPNRYEACFQGGTHPRDGDDGFHEKETRLGDLCMAVGSLEDALDYYRKALASADASDSEERMNLACKVSQCLRRQAKSRQALSFLNSVIDSFGDRERRHLLAERATLLCLTGQYGEAAKVCEQVLAAEAGGERVKDAGIYLVLGHVLARLCRWREAIVCLEQAATFSRMCGDLETLGNAFNNLGIVYKNLSRLKDSARFLRKAVKVARRRRDDASLSVRLLNLAITLLKRGDLEHAELAVSECLRVGQSLSLRRTVLLATICKARIERARGDTEAARQMIEAALPDAKRLDDPRPALLVEETLAEIMVDQGRFGEARSRLENCISSLTVAARDVEAELKSRIAEACAALGRREEARRYASQAADLAHETGDLFEAGRSLRALAAASAQPVKALEYMARAERIFSRIGASFEVAMTLYAKSQLRGIDRSTSTEALRRAIRIFEACSAGGWRTRALCDLALSYESISAHDKASACLDEADTGPVMNPRHREIISAARVRIDNSLSESLCDRVPTCVRSLEEVFAFLATRLGTASIALARRDAGAYFEIVKARGIAPKLATDLVALAATRDSSPWIVTDLADQIPHVRARGVRSMLAVGVGVLPYSGILLACWGGKTGAADAAPRTISLVRAYYEVCRVLPVLERSIHRPGSVNLGICLGGMLTSDAVLARTLVSLPKIARASANVLIMGETGTGKELVARAVHALSTRRDRPFIVQNCAALPEQLLETELFGHKAGAFTGARADKPGLIETANGGTFFLDEVGEVSQAIQAKMLRAIESGEIRRLGDTRSRPVDARFLSATNRDLEADVERGRFRRDLYYRLNVVSISLPPLRGRPADVELLATLFLHRFAASAVKAVAGITEEAMHILAGYDWRGNVRELENEIEKAVTLVRAGDWISAEVLSPRITGDGGAGLGTSLREELHAVERRRILAALHRCAWNKTHTARLLGDISRPALVAKMKRLGIPLKGPDA